jgi:Uma2 family endonuclease
MISILEIPSVRRRAKPIDIRTYHWMGENGLVEEKTELLRGVIVEKMSKSPLHQHVIRFLFQLAQAAVDENHLVEKGNPLTLADSEPEPDISILQGRAADFENAHPTTALLVIEVAISSVDLDREKATIYAEADIPEYWLAIPEPGILEIYTAPKDGIYTKRQVLRRGETAIAEGFPALKVNLDTLFG